MAESLMTVLEEANSAEPNAKITSMGRGSEANDHRPRYKSHVSEGVIRSSVKDYGSLLIFYGSCQIV